MTCQLYRHFDKEGSLLYVGVSLSAVARLFGHQKSGWVDKISRVEIENFADRLSAERAELAAIRQERPQHNKKGAVRISLVDRARASAPGSEDVKFICDEFERLKASLPMTRAEIQKNYRLRKKAAKT